jgi:pimeloyl-ACP methyl ester carboxylesterase
MTDGPLTLDVGVGVVAPPGVEHLVADVFLPKPSAMCKVPVVIVCPPGGGMSRRYFDLRVPDTLGSYSMARHLAAAGHPVVTIDPPGVGDSDRPIDGYSLTPAVVADVVERATSIIFDRFRAGTLSDDFPACADLVAVGLGHSAGGLLTVVQQARHRTFRALALLGFEGGGLIEFHHRRRAPLLRRSSELERSHPLARRGTIQQSASSWNVRDIVVPHPRHATRSRNGRPRRRRFGPAGRRGTGMPGARIGQRGTRKHRSPGLSRDRRIRHHGTPTCHPTAVPRQPRHNGVRPTQRRPQSQRRRQPRSALGPNCCVDRFTYSNRFRRDTGAKHRGEASGHQP